MQQEKTTAKVTLEYTLPWSEGIFYMKHLVTILEIKEENADSCLKLASCEHGRRLTVCGQVNSGRDVVDQLNAAKTVEETRSSSKSI